MTWAEGRVLDSVKTRYFVRFTMRQRILSTSFSLHSGSVYVADWTVGNVHAMNDNGAAVTQGSSTSLAANEFYYDYDLKKLYFRTSTSAAPSSSRFYTVLTHLHVSTEEVYWYTNPDDSSTRQVLWSPLLIEAPKYAIRAQPQAFGFFPIEPTQLEIVNDNSINEIIYNGSFNKAGIRTWQQLGALNVNNVEPVHTGKLAGRATFGDKTITFDVTDNSADFDQKVTGLYAPTGSNTDPKEFGRPLFKVYGFYPEGFTRRPWIPLVNVDYNSSAPTGSNNRTWIGIDDENTAHYNLQVVPGNFTASGNDILFTPTTSTDTEKFGVGDFVYVETAGTDYRGIVADTSSTVVTVRRNGIGSIGSTAGTLYVSTFRQVFSVVESGGGSLTTQKLYPIADFAEYSASNRRGITLGSGVTINNPDTDRVYALIGGRQTLASLGGSDPTEDDFEDKQNFIPSQGLNILYSILRTYAGLAEADIDTASIVAARDVCYWRLYFTMPFRLGDDYPTIREAIDLILKSMLCRAYFDESGLFVVKPYNLISSVDATFTKEELFGFGYEVDNSDMAKVYFNRKFDSPNQSVHLDDGGLGISVWYATNVEAQVSEVAQPIKTAADADTSDEGDYLSELGNVREIEHCVGEQQATAAGPATPYEDRVKDLYANRFGVMKLGLSKEHINRNIGDKVALQRLVLPGEAYDGTDQSTNAEIIEIEKGQDGVEVTLSDNYAADLLASEDYWLPYSDL